MTESTDEMIRRAEVTLEKTISFVRNSENKTQIALAIFGVMLAILFSSVGNIVCLFTNIQIVALFYLTLGLFISSLFVICYGLYVLIKVLSPIFNVIDNINSESSFESDSIIFFKDISINDRFQTYKEKFMTHSSDAYMNDLLSQIYINSKISMIKYQMFKNGLKYSLIGMTGILVSISLLELVGRGVM